MRKWKGMCKDFNMAYDIDAEKQVLIVEVGMNEEK